MLMTSATAATLTGSVSGLFFHAFVAQGPNLDVPGWLTSAGVGGGLMLVFWIVIKELPENRKARREAHANFTSTLKEMNASFTATVKEMGEKFHDELAKERTAAGLERAAWATERSEERGTRHAVAGALNNVASAVIDLGEKREGR